MKRHEVDLANGFLKNPRIIGEKMERKREFLQKKGSITFPTVLSI
jgi:hypothetical protein